MNELQLFITFFYVGLVSIGGGLVTIPVIEQQVVTKGLITPEDFYNMVAISESTPGPIGINVATFVGYRLHGIPGAIVATLGEVMPSLIVIMLIGKFFMPYFKSPIVQKIFFGLKAGVTGMILVALINVYGISVMSFPDLLQGNLLQAIRFPQIIFFVIALVLVFKTKIHPILLVLLGGIFGSLFC